MKTLVAATAIAMALAAAGAASAEDVRVAYGDLALASPAGARQFDRRATRAARTACRGGSRVEVGRCVTALRAEIRALLPSRARQEYARGHSGQQMAARPGFTG